MVEAYLISACPKLFLRVNEKDEVFPGKDVGPRPFLHCNVTTLDLQLKWHGSASCLHCSCRFMTWSPLFPCALCSDDGVSVYRERFLTLL